MTDLAALFRAEGITVREAGDWRSRVRPGSFNPQGIMIHHTGSKGQGDDGLSILIDGRSDLNGPLCNASPRDDGSLVLISAGRANHAGAGSSQVLDRTRHDLAPRGNAADLGLVDDITGNGWYYGLEVDNSGGPNDPYPPEQYDTVVRACAALCRHHDWTALRVIGHKEWTRRKVDWSLSMSGLRGNVARRLKTAVLVHGVWTVPPPSPGGGRIPTSSFPTANPSQEDVMASLDEVRQVVREELKKAVDQLHAEHVLLLHGDKTHGNSIDSIAKKVGVPQ